MRDKSEVLTGAQKNRFGLILYIILLSVIYILTTRLNLTATYYSLYSSLDENSQVTEYFIGFAPIFPDTCYHLTHYWLAAVDIPVASDNPVHYADAIRYNARTPLQGSLLPLTRLVWA